MYNIGPLDRLNRYYQQLKGEGSYWLRRIQRLIPGQSANLPEMPAGVKGSPVLPIVVAGCLVICCCLAFLVVAIGLYLLPAFR